MWTLDGIQRHFLKCNSMGESLMMIDSVQTNETPIFLSVKMRIWDEKNVSNS